jgi:hypothetical protein
MNAEADYNRSVSRYPCIRTSPFRPFVEWAVEWASRPATPAFVPAFFVAASVLCGAGAFACQRVAHP